MTKIEDFIKLDKEFFVSITGLKVKFFWMLPRFYFHAIPSKIQAEKAPGNLYVEVKKVDGFQHTLTAWESKKHLLDFVYSSPHNKAIKAFTSIAHGKTCHFKTKKFPSWDYALEYWKAHGKEY